MHNIGQMITTFRCSDAEALFNRHRSTRFRSIEHVARRKLAMLNKAQSLPDFHLPSGNRLRNSSMTAKASPAFESTTSGGFVLSGVIATLVKWRSSIISEEVEK